MGTSNSGSSGTRWLWSFLDVDELDDGVESVVENGWVVAMPGGRDSSLVEGRMRLDEWGISELRLSVARLEDRLAGVRVEGLAALEVTWRLDPELEVASELERIDELPGVVVVMVRVGVEDTVGTDANREVVPPYTHPGPNGIEAP